ncbi:MAG: signal peptide peptidase SppA [Planctomycetota bacterium]|nr:signal peptide peptidase SppA [Planctomycetota bacterium]
MEEFSQGMQDPNKRPVVRARMVDNPPRSGGGFKGIVAFFLIGGMFMFFCVMSSLINPGANTANLAGDPWDKLQEKTYRSGTKTNRVLLLRCEGVIMSGGSSGLLGTPAPSMVKRIKNSLIRAAKDDTIKAIVLRVDSPGGGVTASDQIYDAILKYKKATNKPVIVSMGGICASGGYYVSAPADWIFAEPTTITGSIGVIMQGMNFSKLFDKYGIQDVSITSGPNKALLNSSAPIDEQHLKILQTTVDSMYGRFVEIVATGRKLSKEEIKAKNIADGRVFTADQALELKLVDQVGYLEAALEEAKKRAGDSGGQVFEYVSQPTFLDLFQAKAGVNVQVGPKELSVQGPRYLYLWKP